MQPNFAQLNAHAEDWARNPQKMFCNRPRDIVQNIAKGTATQGLVAVNKVDFIQLYLKFI